jgi:hypothetical protein
VAVRYIRASIDVGRGRRGLQLRNRTAGARPEENDKMMRMVGRIRCVVPLVSAARRQQIARENLQRLLLSSSHFLVPCGLLLNFLSSGWTLVA